MAWRGRGFDMTIIYADPRRLTFEEESKPNCLPQLRRAVGRVRFCFPGAVECGAYPPLGSAVKPLRESMANVVVDNVIALIEGRPPCPASIHKC
jgi:lactate dehydrogenase-like 2-hydroxyacid dehydrogenase